MKETNIANLTVNVGLGVDFDTVCTCIKLIELYLNKNPDEELVIYCSECGDWDLGITDRKRGGEE